VEGDAIRCYYHGWKYDAAGRCVEQPAEPQPFCEKVRIRSYPCVEYIGCVWAYLGEGEPPPPPRYPVFEEPGVLDVLTYIWPCNYFQAIENQHDQSHIPFVHRESSPFKGGGLTVAGVPTLRAEESEYGLTIHGNWSNGSVRKNHWFMPNTIQIKQPVGYSDSRWMDLIEIIVPVDDEHHARFHMSLIPVTGDEAEEFRERRQERHEGMDSVAAVAERVLAGELRVDDVSLPPAMMVNLQDAVAQLGQDTIADREHERLGRSDTVVIAMRQLWERELRALDEGRPLKQWTHPGRLVSTSGIRA
jgi:5,5'-dehydrodivanillate O-demethylase